MERFQDKPASQRELTELVGPYVLLAEIGRGELTTVYLAKKHSALGFQRLYALKRLKPALALNADCVELLHDEARLVSGIHHANIAGVLDVGNDAGNYVVMEYVEGENLEALLARAGTARHPRFIVPAFVDALNGLHALHTATDADGEPFSIVHQAPRARHIVVGIDGTSRLVDFSQVRGRNVRPTRSRSDRIKVAHMAPEQALHPDGVDLRADLFIVGVTLWEALTGERLFASDTDEQTFQNMLHRRIPRPSDTGLRPPRCFDAICMRALERDPKNRYESAQEMARDLRDTAINQALYATASELGQWVRQLAGSDLRTLRKLAGQDQSSGSISLETPALGMELSGLKRAPLANAGSGLARLSDGLVAVAGPSEAANGINENPYASGRIYGGAAVGAVDPQSAHTPALGFRREKPLPREEEDDDPTGPRVLPKAARPVFDERARAATVPVAAPAAGALARTGDVETREQNDEPNTNVFVPARPGARRDGNRISPGAYSQVDGSRRQTKSRAPDTELEIPSSKLAVAVEAGASARAGSQQKPAFEEADTTVRPQLAPGPDDVQAPPKVRAETKSYEAARAGAQRSASAPASNERRGTITEHPPTYVQRRDSSPTRMEIPAEPVGSPHRPFTPERLPALGQRAPRAANHPFDLGTAPTQQALPLPDSLTPPTAATRTMPPPEPQQVPRPSALWLVSGVLAAIILLALGVGVKQWMAGDPPPRARVSHAASGGSSSNYESSTLRAEPTPATGQTAPTPANSALTPPAAPPSRSAADLVAPAKAPSTLDAARDAALRASPKTPARAPQLKRERAAKAERPLSEPKRENAGGLPDNPY